MKKLFTLIVAICATTFAWADDSGSCGENVTYSFVESTGTLTISGTGNMRNYNDYDWDYTNEYKAPWYNYRSSIKKVVINNGVTSIGDYAFLNCKGLTSITIPNSVTSIGSYAFSSCRGLTSITIPNSVTSIGDMAFYYCTGLTSVTIPNSVTSIGNYVFSGCTGLTSIEIPNSVTSIGDFAFADCKGLTSITIPNSVTSIGGMAFYGCTGLTSVTIPNSVTSIGSSAFSGCTGLRSINVAEDNLNYTSIDGVLYSKDKKTLIMCPNGKTGSITIPNSVTSIGGSAFYRCTGLTSIEIPNSVTSIGEYAFYGCAGLTSVTIPNSVTSIGRQAFYNFTGLTSMTVEATKPPYYSYYSYNSSTTIMVSNYNIPLYVPAGSVNAYKRADEWKKFTNIQAIPATGVKETTAEKREVKKIIDRNGIIYIEKDGTRYFLNGDKVE